MNNPTLQLYPEPSPDAVTQQFSLIGTIDVHAIPTLERLYVLPEDCIVELDFAMVQRVNSMGLAQVLKLFNHWQQRAIHISVINTNRMIGILFKMTNLDHFLAHDQQSVPPAENVATQYAPHNDYATAPLSTAFVNNASAASHPNGKLKLWVNAQNNQQINGWYFFNTHLQRHLGREVQMELVQGAISAKGELIEQMDIVFTTPFMAARLLLEHSFCPLVRPIEQTDEVTLLVRADEPRQGLTDFSGAKVVTAAPDNFVYLLGRFLLYQLGTDARYLFSGYDVKALQLLLKGNADMLLMSSDSYHALANITKRMLREIDQSETGFAFYLFCLSPKQRELSQAISQVLLTMNQDGQGRQVLKDLNIEGWTTPKADEIYMMEMLYKRYASAVNNTPPPEQRSAALAPARVS